METPIYLKAPPLREVNIQRFKASGSAHGQFRQFLSTTNSRTNLSVEEKNVFQKKRSNHQKKVAQNDLKSLGLKIYLLKLPNK